MTFLEFRDKMFELGCFNTHQVYAWDPGFDRNNFVRWVKKGLLLRLRQGYYTFPEYKGQADFALFFANRIYRPSYISLHTALAFFGLIPEAVVQITSVTSLKTASFQNDLGSYAYKSVREELMFGYRSKAIGTGQSIQLAQPEKALLDLLYLYPFYHTGQDMEELRMDEDFLQDDFDPGLFDEYLHRFKSKALEKRIKLFLNTYGL